MPAAEFASYDEPSVVDQLQERVLNPYRSFFVSVSGAFTAQTIGIFLTQQFLNFVSIVITWVIVGGLYKGALLLAA